MNLLSFIQRVQVAILKKSSSKMKIAYLRKQGMKIGKNCRFNTMSFSTEPYLIEIGDHVAIADGSDLITHDGGIWCFRDELEHADIFGEIKIGNNVFIGNRCIILPNTRIGDNCIVGAGSVLRGKFPDNSVIVGNPAKVILNMSMQKFLYKQNPGLLMTENIPSHKKAKIVKKHFGKKED